MVHCAGVVPVDRLLASRPTRPGIQRTSDSVGCVAQWVHRPPRALHTLGRNGTLHRTARMHSAPYTTRNEKTRKKSHGIHLLPACFNKRGRLGTFVRPPRQRRHTDEPIQQSPNDAVRIVWELALASDPVVVGIQAVRIVATHHHRALHVSGTVPGTSSAVHV
jgi:hypothetical protein